MTTVTIDRADEGAKELLIAYMPFDGDIVYVETGNSALDDMRQRNISATYLGCKPYTPDMTDEQITNWAMSLIPTFTNTPDDGYRVDETTHVLSYTEGKTTQAVSKGYEEEDEE